MEFVILNNNKTPTHSFKDGGKPWEQVKTYDNLGVIIPEPYIILDFDHEEDAEIMNDIVSNLNLNCNVMKTDRGYHYWFKSKNKFINNTNVYLACGIKADIKCYGKPCYAMIKRNGELRKWLKQVDDVCELPSFLSPVGNDYNVNFKEMKNGEGRNNGLYNYIPYLQKKKFSVEEIKECIRVINEYVFDEPLPDKELNTILRDESFERVPKLIYPVMNGKRVHPCVQNIKTLLDFLGINIKLNIISNKVEIIGSEEFTNVDYRGFVTLIEAEAPLTGLIIGRKKLINNLDLLLQHNEYNPLWEFFQSCYAKWDGKESHIEEFLKCLEIEPGHDIEFIQMLIKKWMIQGIKLANNDGTIAPQTILILLGRQGIGKSRLISKLLPDHPELILTEQKINPTIKDDRILVTQYGITELSEFARSLKDLDGLKSFLTSSKDTYRPPYGEFPKTFNRHTNFIGSINDRSFLLDGTGERRFSVVPLKSIRWYLFDNLDMKQVWGEVYHLAVDLKQPFWLSQEEIAKQNLANKNFRVLTDLEQKLYDTRNFDAPSEEWQTYTATDVATYILGNRYKANSVGRILANLVESGVIPKPVTKNGSGAKKYYKLPPEYEEIKKP